MDVYTYIYTHKERKKGKKKDKCDKIVTLENLSEGYSEEFSVLL